MGNNDRAARQKRLKQLKQRSSKERRRLYIGLGLGFSAVVLTIIIAFNFDAIVAPLEGIGRTFTLTNTRTVGGFPVRLPGNMALLEDLGDDGFMLLSSSFYYAYNNDGVQTFARRHGYSLAKASVNGGRVLVYDNNGNKFSVYARNALAFENELENEKDIVLFAAISRSGNVAVAVRAENHVNLLMTYDSNGDWLYTNPFTRHNIMQAAFGEGVNDGRFVIITTIAFDAGRMSTTVRKLDTTSDDKDGVWQTALTTLADSSSPLYSDDGESLLPIALEVRRNKVYVLCNSALFVLSPDDGSVIGRYSFHGTVVDYAFADEHAALLVNDFTAGNMNLITLDDSAKQIAMVQTDESATQVKFSGRGEQLALLMAGRLMIYEDAQTIDIENAQTHRLSEEYGAFTFAGDNVLLLGYNTVTQLFESENASESTGESA